MRRDPPYFLTAYGLAVKHGFVGTEEEWLKSIKGYTPQRGVDYWTEEDKQEMVSAVLEALPKAEEVSF